MYHTKNIVKRNKLIYEDYIFAYFTEFKREEKIWDELGKKYFLSERSIYLIVLKLRKEAQDSQPELPLNLDNTNGTDKI